MTHFIPGPHRIKHPLNRPNPMMQPGGFRTVTGGPSIFGNPYHAGCRGGYGYGNYGSNYGYPVSGYQAGGCCDADDGKISFGEKVGSFFKGIGKTITNGVKSLFTPKGFLKAVGIGALCFFGGPVVTAVVAGIGIAKGAGTVIKGAKQAKYAQTDAEAKAAWENIGGGTFTAAASAVALKGCAGSIKAAGGVKASFNASRLGKGFKAAKDVKIGKNATWTKTLGKRFKAGTKATFKGTKLEGLGRKLSTAKGKLRAKAANAYDNIKGKSLKDLSSAAREKASGIYKKGSAKVSSAYGKASKTIKSNYKNYRNQSKLNEQLEAAVKEYKANPTPANKGKVTRISNNLAKVNQINGAGLGLLDEANEMNQYYI